MDVKCMAEIHRITGLIVIKMGWQQIRISNPLSHQTTPLPLPQLEEEETYPNSSRT